jgi:hypothetical protein
MGATTEPLSHRAQRIGTSSGVGGQFDLFETSRNVFCHDQLNLVDPVSKGDKSLCGRVTRFKPRVSRMNEMLLSACTNIMRCCLNANTDTLSNFQGLIVGVHAFDNGMVSSNLRLMLS